MQCAVFQPWTWKTHAIPNARGGNWWRINLLRWPMFTKNDCVFYATKNNRAILLPRLCRMQWFNHSLIFVFSHFDARNDCGMWLGPSHTSNFKAHCTLSTRRYLQVFSIDRSAPSAQAEAVAGGGAAHNLMHLRSVAVIEVT